MAGRRSTKPPGPRCNYVRHDEPDGIDYPCPTARISGSHYCGHHARKVVEERVNEWRENMVEATVMVPAVEWANGAADMLEREEFEAIGRLVAEHAAAAMFPAAA